MSYQAGGAGVAPQVKALYEALQQAGIRYVNSVLAFSPDDGLSSQRVRLPRKTLESKNANCLDGTVLFASLLEAITLQAGDRAGARATRSSPGRPIPPTTSRGPTSKPP